MAEKADFITAVKMVVLMLEWWLLMRKQENKPFSFTILRRDIWRTIGNQQMMVFFLKAGDVKKDTCI